jgi:hypothetical protein
MWIRIPLAMLGPEHLAPWAGSPVAYLLVWLCREALWWFLATMLLAVLARLVLTSAIGASLFAWPGAAQGGGLGLRRLA